MAVRNSDSNPYRGYSRQGIRSPLHDIEEKTASFRIIIGKQSKPHGTKPQLTVMGRNLGIFEDTDHKLSLLTRKRQFDPKTHENIGGHLFQNGSTATVGKR